MTSRPSRFHYTIACRGDRWRVYLSGEFDLARQEEMVTLASAFGGPEVSDLTIDLTNVTFIDSAGYETIRRAAATIRAGGAQVRLVNASQPVRRLERAMQLVGR